MANDLYSDTLEELQQPETPAAPKNPYLDELRSEDAAAGLSMRQARAKAADTDPDRAAKVQQLATQTGLPNDVVDRNYEDLSKRQFVDDLPYAQVQKQTPALAQWASKPENAAVAKDDMEQLGALEWLLKAPSRAVAQTLNSQAYGALRTQSLFRDLTRDEQDRLNTYKLRMADGGQLGTEGHWFRGAITGGIKLGTMLTSTVPVYGLTGAAGGAVLGTLVEPGAGTLAGAKLGFQAGNLYGLGKMSFQTEAGAAYDQYLEIKDNLGQPIDPKVARMAALATGAVNAALMTGGGSIIAKSIGAPLEKLGSVFVRDAVTQALAKPTVRAALLNAAKIYGTNLTEGTALMVGMRAVNILGSEIAKTAAEQGTRPDYGYGPRFETGEPKGLGYLGPLQRPDGSVMSEFSTGIEINGKETQIPSIVPTLTREEVTQLLTAKEGEPLPPAVIAKAQAFAQQRISAGKSPFAGAGEQQNLYPDLARAQIPPQRRPEFTHATTSEVVTQLLHAAAEGAQGFALAAAVGPGLGAAHDIARAARAKDAPAFFQALGEGVTQSKTAQRMPEAARDFIAQATKDGPVETLYAPVDTWKTYWQSKGVDPADMAERVVGSRDAYEHALNTGEDLPIPTARYATTLAATEHNAFFANELKLGPDEMNGRQAAEQIEKIKAANTPETPPESPVRANVLAKLQGAGVPTDTAAHYADLYESAIGTLADRAGVDAGQLFEQYGLKIEREGMPVAEPAVEQPPELTDPTMQAVLPEGIAEERRVAEGVSPTGTERRNEPTSGTAVERAAQMRRENPDIDRIADTKRAEALTKTRGRVEESAVFLAHGPDGPLYNIVGGPRNGSTVTKATLGHMQIDVPETPPNTGERLSGDEIRKRMLASRVVDKNLDRQQNPENYFNAEGRAAAQEGARPRDAEGEQPGAHGDRPVEAGGDGASTEPRRLPSAQLPGLDEVFTRQTAEDTAARLTPDVRRELERIVDELETFPYEGRQWHFLEGQKTGNAAGGAADVRAGHAGAPVYDDIRYFSPLNKGKGGEPAKKVHGTRGDVVEAARKLLETGEAHNNLAEGALRVAMNRAADDYALLSSPSLPPSWGREAPREFTDALSSAIDAAAAPTRDMLDQDSFRNEETILEPDGPVDTSFNVDEFNQSLFDDLEPPDPIVDTLTTGEQQPRLPGAENVRDQEQPTPDVAEAPFALSSDVAKPRTGKQRALFQTVYHGTPHTFDEFSMHAIGNGQGAQTYGWGLYFASRKEIADRYREELAGKQRDKHLAFKSPDDSNVADGDIFQSGGLYHSALSPAQRQGLGELYARAHFAPAGPEGLKRIRRELEQTIANGDARKAHNAALPEGALPETLSGSVEVDSYRLEEAKYALGALNDFGDQLEIRPPERPGRTYTVEVPDEDYLDWDKTASQQSPKVQDALRALGVTWDPVKVPTFKQAMRIFESRRIQDAMRSDIGIRESLREGLHYVQTENQTAWENWYGQHQGHFARGMTDPTGDTIYQNLQADHAEQARRENPGNTDQWRRGAQRASEALAQLGVNGIRYLDGFSRAAGEGTHNFVVFDSKLAQITEFNQGPRELTQTHIDAWTKEMQDRLGADLASLDVRVTAAGDLNLVHLAIARGAQRAGLGSDVVRELTRLADLNGKRITLDVAQRGAAWGTTSRSRLVQFYKRFGFVENKGRHIDFTLSASMYREPTLPGTLGQPFFHGSPHDFEKFSMEKVGTGEGAAAYGHGLYFAENPAVAADYHDRLSEGRDVTKMKLGSLSIKDPDWEYTRRAHVNSKENIRASIAEELLSDPLELNAAGEKGFRDYVLGRVDRRIKAYETEYPEGVAAAKELRAELEKPGALAVEFSPTTGGIYQVEIPEEHVAKMLDWDKPLSQQPENVQAALAEISPDDWKPGSDDYDANERGELTYIRLSQILGAIAGDKLPQWMQENGVRIPNQAAASRLLKDHGVPGLRYLDQGSRDQGEGTRNVVVFDDSIITLTHKDGSPVTPKERDEYFQSKLGDEGPTAPKPDRRGAIRFGADRQFTISLLERADPSTFLHESGHFFLEVFGDLADRLGQQDPATLTDTQRRLLADYGALFQHWGIDNRDQVGEKQHEEFARSFEAYLMKGEAPALALQGTFARFRAWLVGVYRSLSNLHVELTPEVRGILDRMVASDRAIQDAEAQRNVVALFTSPEEAGMTPAEFGLYRRTVEDASRTARETLDRKLFADVQREQTAQWKARRAEIKTGVENETYQKPEYRAIAAMARGTHPNGEPLVEGMVTDPLKLNRQLLEERFGADRAKRLPRGIVAREGGVDPAVVARMFGFASDDAMLKAVEQAPPMRAAIEQEVKQRMFQENGNTLLDGTLHEKAAAAVMNEDRDLVIRAELRALNNLRRTVAPFEAAARKGADAERTYERRWLEAEAKLRIAIAEGHKQVEIDKLTKEVSDLKATARGGAVAVRAGIPNAATLKTAADARISALPIGNIHPEAFWSASRRSAQMAYERAARQDFDGAIQAKTQELINVTLFRTASAALEAVDTGVKFARSLMTPAARSRIGLAGESYLDQVDGILDRYEFAKVPDKVLERRASLRDWAEAQVAAGLPADQLPEDLLQEASRKNYKEMTLEEFTGVTDGLRQIAHLAALKNRLLKAQDAREFADVRDGAVASIYDNNLKRPKKLEFTPGDERLRSVSGWFAAHMKISRIAQSLDGNQDGGAFWTAFMKPINEAADAEGARRGHAADEYFGILEQHYPKGEIRRLQDKRDVPGVGSLSKEARLAVALNWGNETSRDRVLSDPQRGWNREQVGAILDTLDKRDWDFVQATFDYINRFWPEIAAKQERVTGIAPEKVEAAPIETQFGTYAGGYYPLQYDSRFSPRVAANELASKAKLETSAAYVRTTTKRGHVEARKANVKLPIRLDLSVVHNHLDQVIHDLTHHETLIDVTRLLRDPTLSRAIIDTKGDQAYHALTTALQDIALGSSGGPRNAMDKAATYLRTGSQIAQLGFNLWTGLKVPEGIFNGAARIGPQWVARGAYRWLRDASTMTNTLTWINEVSPMMRERGQSLSQDVSDLRNAFREPGGWFDGMVRKVTNDHVSVQAITDAAMWHIGMAYRLVEVPTWLGQYEKSMAAGEPEERAFRIADQSVLDTHGGGNIKDLAAVQRGGPIARLFMQFYTYGGTVYNATAREFDMVNPKSPASVGRFLGHLGLLYMMPAALSVGLKTALGKDDTKKFFENVGRESAAIALNTMVLVRELGALAEEGNRGYGGPAGTRFFEMATELGNQVKQGKADEALAKAVANVGAVLLHIPGAMQIERTIDGWIALEEGRTKNPAALVVGPPPKNQQRK